MSTACERRVIKLPCGHEEELDVRCTAGSDPSKLNHFLFLSRSSSSSTDLVNQQKQVTAITLPWLRRINNRLVRAYHLPAPGTLNEVYRRGVGDGTDGDTHDHNDGHPTQALNSGQVPGAPTDGYIYNDDPGENTSTAVAVVPPVSTRGNVADIANHSDINPHAPRATLREQTDHPYRFHPQFYYPPATQSEFQHGQYQYPPQQPYQGYSSVSRNNFPLQHYSVQTPAPPPPLRREDAYDSGQQVNGATTGNGAPSHAGWYDYGDENKENDWERADGLYYD
ncbi:MAG: hypothetical protein LQ352_006526 [Teloschistes flavicans]|nr:MAG: hypothetical protein LQ352_006526 [Teloschistes flavicans]